MIRGGWVLWLIPIGVISAALFYISQEVQALQRELSGLNRDIVEERDSIRVLRAEWAYLNRPDWLVDLADNADLTLEPIRGDQIVASVATIPMPLPESLGVDADEPMRMPWARAPEMVAVLTAPDGYQLLPLPLRRPPEEPPLMFAGGVAPTIGLVEAPAGDPAPAAPEQPAGLAAANAALLGPVPLPPPRVTAPVQPVAQPLSTQAVPALAQPAAAPVTQAPSIQPPPVSQPVLVPAIAQPPAQAPDGQPLMLRIRR